MSVAESGTDKLNPFRKCNKLVIDSNFHMALAICLWLNLHLTSNLNKYSRKGEVEQLKIVVIES